MPSHVPERGDIVRISFDPQAWHEQAGRRPALVLSGSSYNQKSGLALCCPITRQAKGYTFELPLPSGIEVTGVVLVDHVKSLDWQERRAEFICAAPPAIVRRAWVILGALASEGG